MPLDAATIRIALQTDASGMVSGFAAGSAAASGFDRAVTKSLANVRSAYDRMSGSQKFIAGAAIAGTALAVAMKAVIGPAIEFESAFAGVRKTVDGSPAQLQAIREGLLDMSTVMPTSADQLAAIAENAGQLGVAAPQVLEFTRTVAMLGETTDLDFEEAAQSLARFLNVTGDGAGAIGSVADVIVELGNNSATTESQIVNFSTRLASAFTVAGATSDEILAIAAAFSSMGIRAEAGGSALSKIITSISDAAIDGGEDLQTYAETAGLQPEEFAAIAQASPVEALLLVGDGLRRVQEEGGTITPILEALELGGLRTSEIFRLLALNTDSVRASLSLAAGQMEEGGAAAEEYGKRIETTASRIEILRNRLTTLAIEAGTPALDLVAASADGLGDAIVHLIDLLRPLASEMGATFGNAAEAAGQFYEVLGRPALLIAAAAISGLTQTATSLLAVFNSLGSTGTIAAAGILAIGLNAGTVASLVARLVLSASLAGTSFTAMAVGARAASAALAASPYILVAGALVAVGKAYYDAGNQARDAASDFRAAAEEAFQTGTYDEVTASLTAITDRYDDLAASSARVESGADGWTRFGRAIVGVKDVLTPFTENTLANTTAEMDELQSLLGDLGLGNFDDSVRLAAQGLEITEDRVVALARELGVLDQLTKGTTADFYEAVNAIALQVIATDALAEKTGVAADAILDGSATLDDFAAGLQVTGSQLEFLTAKIDDVDIEDFLDPEKLGESFDAVEALISSYTALADQMGVSVQTYIDQLMLVNDLAVAHSELGDEISHTAGVMDAAREANNLAADASLEFAAALDAVSASGDGLEQLGPAFESYQLAIAATTGSLDEFKGQQAAAALAMAEAGAAAGLSGPQIAQLIQAYTVPDAQILQIQDLGASLAGASQEFTALQAQALKGILVELGVVDEASPVIVSVLESLRLFATTEEEAYTAALAAADAGSLGLIADSSLEAEQFEDDYQAELSVEAQAALANLEAVRSALRDFTESEYIAFLLANGVDAEEAIRLTADYADTAWVTEFPAILTADGTGAIEVIGLTAGQANDYAAADYGSILTADGSAAVATTEETESRQLTYADAEYLSFLTANGDLADAETDATGAYQDDMTGQPYQSTLTADGSPARGETDATGSHQRLMAAQKYESTLTANGRAAINVANEVNRAIRGIPTVWSTSIITYYRTVDNRYDPRNGPGADGLINAGGARLMADGGVSRAADGMNRVPGGPLAGSPVSALQGTPEPFGDAQIHGPRYPWRIYHSEGETEGEAFIPLAPSKRARSLRIWEQTGRLLGAMADGGIQNIPRGGPAPSGTTLIQIAPTIQVDASGTPGLDAQEVADIASRAVTQQLTTVGRKLSNTRIL